ncbi:MAG: hypothetical protein U5J64_10390 [Halobacteriales archaeon]|nr:hypothetical protein [Halobacteriales archaeon]
MSGFSSGVIGTVDGSFDRIDSWESSEKVDGKTVSRCVEIQETDTTSFENSTLQKGRAAAQRISTRQIMDISDGSIKSQEEEFVDTAYTEFISLSNEFIAVESSSGKFAFDLLASNLPVRIDGAEFDLEGYLEDHPDSSPWQVSFYGHTGEAEKGTVYGSRIFDDSDMGSVVENCPKSQIGLVVERDDYEIKFSLTEQGYVTIYQPSNYDKIEFAKFVKEDLLPYIK